MCSHYHWGNQDVKLKIECGLKLHSMKLKIYWISDLRKRKNSDWIRLFNLMTIISGKEKNKQNLAHQASLWTASQKLWQSATRRILASARKYENIRDVSDKHDVQQNNGRHNDTSLNKILIELTRGEIKNGNCRKPTKEYREYFSKTKSRPGVRKPQLVKQRKPVYVRDRNFGSSSIPWVINSTH